MKIVLTKTLLVACFHKNDLLKQSIVFANAPDFLWAQQRFHRSCDQQRYLKLRHFPSHHFPGARTAWIDDAFVFIPKFHLNSLRLF